MPIAERTILAIVIAFVIVGLCLIGIAIKDFYASSKIQSQQSKLPDQSGYNKNVINYSILALCLGGAGVFMIVISIWAWFKRD
jgi:hypothetical protein